MAYHIISTGKQGNCVFNHDIMVDCGVDIHRIAPFIGGIKYLLLTHIHTDHVDKDTLDTIKAMYPHVTIIGNQSVHDKFGVHHVITHDGTPVITPDYAFYGFEMTHNVETTAFMWRSDRGEDFLFAVDTADLSRIPAGLTFDCMFLESNYDEVFVQELNEWIASKNRLPITEYQRHLSRQQAWDFYLSRRKSEQSRFIELHPSESFYSRETSPFILDPKTPANEKGSMFYASR